MLGKKPKIIFMGTPGFAAVILEKLIAENFNIASVFTQPDKKTGRSQALVQSAVKKSALRHGLRVFEPASLKTASVRREIEEINPDLIIVAAYGKILPQEILILPKFGALNVHASLLPKYRGASPIQAVILANEKKTGVTLMLMDKGVDTGNILSQTELAIAADDDAQTLAEKLADAGARLLVETIPDWVGGKLKPSRQNEVLASYAGIVARDHGKIDWREPAEEIHRKWRAYRPWPGIFTTFRNSDQEGKLKLIEISVQSDADTREKSGKVIEYNGNVAVQAKKGLVILKKVQLAGKKEMIIEDFVRGRDDFLGSILG